MAHLIIIVIIACLQCSLREQAKRPERDAMFRTLQRKGVNLAEMTRSPVVRFYRTVGHKVTDC